MRFIRLTASCLFIWACIASASQAGLMVCTTSDGAFDPGVKNQGWYSNMRVNVDSNANYVTGFVGLTEFRSFFTFDLRALGANDVITAATLTLSTFDFTTDITPFEILQFFDVSTPAAQLNDNTYNFGTFQDLGSGNSYGMFLVNPGSSPSELTFQLNSAALADMNAAKGNYFSIGGTLVTRTAIEDYVFGASGLGGEQSLTLNVEQNSVVTPIPEFASLVMFGLGALGTGVAFRKRKPQAKVAA